MSDQEKTTGLGLVVGWIVITILALASLGWGGIGVSIIVAAILADCLVRVSTINYGVVTIFSRRTNRVLSEGWHIILPLNINRVEMIPFELKTAEITVPVFSKDKVKLPLEGTVQYRPVNPWGPDGKLRLGPDGKKPLVFYYMEAADATIGKGLTDTVKDELGTIAGLYDADVFIESRETLALIINCVLRLEKLPHLVSRNWINKAGKKGSVPDDERLEFYRASRPSIRKKLGQEVASGKLSLVELRYGLDIESFAMAEVGFTEKVEQAMAREREEEAKRIGAKKTIQQVVESMTELQSETGLNRQEAYDVASTVSGASTPRRIVEVRGLEKGGLPIINLDQNSGGA